MNERYVGAYVGRDAIFEQEAGQRFEKHHPEVHSKDATEFLEAIDRTIDAWLMSGKGDTCTLNELFPTDGWIRKILMSADKHSDVHDLKCALIEKILQRAGAEPALLKDSLRRLGEQEGGETMTTNILMHKKTGGGVDCDYTMRITVPKSDVNAHTEMGDFTYKLCDNYRTAEPPTIE